ncbi:alpha/beta fold hydrolase [Pseudoroseomonas cervicalis]|uniref:alpha/beta fold hydrolase n=1 Tax=Teichococcus cervicalis TaxID=204525 RepID=UPI0022F15939|nr:alpha/beta fold hydrolase [Pseudoroseomonas cervicalis]WBV43765.1 alpha/beta fold hydrolase [Pseudoroseomonas cervicalis]
MSLPRRRGPRPLPLHLNLALLRGMGAALSLGPAGSAMPFSPGSPSWSDAWPISRTGRAELQRISHALAAGGHDPERFRAAVLRRLARQDRALIAGLAAYRRHPYRREMPSPPVLWQEGDSRLLDYGGDGPPVLVVPSLVNRAEVLDLLPGHSLLRWLAGQGCRVLLLDWGWPQEAERGFTLTDYIAGRLERAIAAPALAPLGKLALVGYCMGGLLALAAALRRPERLRGLALLATPWDFHAGDAATRERALALSALLPGLEPLLQSQGALPVDVIQTLFAGLDPWGIAAKFRAFAAMDPDSPRAQMFVALEDWLNDGIPLAAPVAREALGGWYGRNETARLRWRVAGAVVDPAALAVPSFVAIPQADRIVPPDSAAALAALLPGAHIRHVPAGHIGMAAGSRAEAVLWQPLREWLGPL